MALTEIAPGVAWLPLGITNVYFAGPRGGPWVLIDTGLPGRARQIREAAESRFGANARPEAILLTHGHRDHSGSALDLATLWDVSMFVHPLEMPYLTGRSSYPPPDPTVGGFLGLMGRFVSPAVFDLGDRVRTLEVGREAPGLKGWEWHHTPGHSPGHVVFFRRDDGLLLGGDALITVNLDSFLELAIRRRRISRPPTPFTCDWHAARQSVRQIAELRPLTVACGHGTPMTGSDVVVQLAELAVNFPMPPYGRYVDEPARTDETGVVSLPPKPRDALPGIAAGIGIAAAAGTMFALAASRRKRKTKAGTPARAS